MYHFVISTAYLLAICTIPEILSVKNFKKMLVINFVHAKVKINVFQASPTYKNSGSSWKIPGARNSPMAVYSPTRDSRADSASIHSASSSRSSSTR